MMQVDGSDSGRIAEGYVFEVIPGPGTDERPEAVAERLERFWNDAARAGRLVVNVLVLPNNSGDPPVNIYVATMPRLEDFSEPRALPGL
jgi:hypothetical protein